MSDRTGPIPPSHLLSRLRLLGKSRYSAQIITFMAQHRTGGPQADGTVFALTPQASICKTANCFWTQKSLYQFSGSPDGQYPGTGDLIWDSTGNIYGTTTYGGPSNLGTVYEMTKSGNNWTETPIYSFTGPDGAYPYGRRHPRWQRKPVWHNCCRWAVRVWKCFRVDIYRGDWLDRDRAL